MQRIRQINKIIIAEVILLAVFMIVLVIRWENNSVSGYQQDENSVNENYIYEDLVDNETVIQAETLENLSDGENTSGENGADGENVSEENMSEEENMSNEETENQPQETPKNTKKEFIKWVDFDVSYKALSDAYQYDVDTYQKEVHISWIDLLAILGAKYGGDFSRYKSKDMLRIVDQLTNKETTLEEMTKDMKYYNYYKEVYTAVLGGLVGEFEVSVEQGEGASEPLWEKKYGLKGYLPIAKNFPFNDYDDFGVSRSYGYKRRHLGHDMMGQVGTPIIAIESGYVEAIGWNQYGGWRLGIRSFDKKRYYYYAHLRKNFPYNLNLKEGSIVTAGQVIGYLGRTGYSKTENTNNIDTPHLHVGLQIIFDESQKEGYGEIWVDCYNLIRFLYKNRSETIKNQETKEWYAVKEIKDPLVEAYNSGPE